MNPTGPAFHKPKSFIAAKNILYAAIFLGVLAIIVHDLVFDNKTTNWLLSLSVAIASYIIIILLVKQISLCKKWARTVLAVLVILIVVSVTISFAEGYITNIIESTLAALQAVLYIAALIFLYKNECNIWLNSTQDEIELKQDRSN